MNPVIAAVSRVQNPHDRTFLIVAKRGNRFVVIDRHDGRRLDVFKTRAGAESFADKEDLKIKRRLRDLYGPSGTRSGAPR